MGWPPHTHTVGVDFPRAVGHPLAGEEYQEAATQLLPRGG